MKPKTLIARPLNLSLSDRRVVLLGAGASLLLAACGGGGGDSKPKTLKEVYDRIEPGMDNDDVTELAGFGPYATGEDTWWNLDGEFLRTHIYNPLITGETGADRYRIRHVYYWTSTFSTGKEFP